MSNVQRDRLAADEVSVEQIAREIDRDSVINKLGNLTLLTHSLNTTVSNGAFSTKMPAIRAHASLALNRELNAYDKWDEETVAQRGSALFEVAQRVWVGPPSADVMP